MTYDVILFTGIDQPIVKTFGAYKCAHELRQAGFSTIVINLVQTFSLEELKQLISLAAGANTLFVGVSNTFLNPGFNEVNKSANPTRMSRNSFLPVASQEPEFVAHLKQVAPNAKIVLGGCRTTLDSCNPLIDYAIVGYADVSIVNLAKHLRYNTDLPNMIKNLNRVNVINDPVAEKFDFVNSTMTWCDDDIVIAEETLPLEISRGCVFSCRFCNYRLNGKQNLDYIKKFDTIKQELISNYERYGITRYRFLDDTFNDTEEKLDIMIDLVRSLPFKPEFWAYARLDLLSKHPGTIQKLYDIGLRSLFFGIETLNKRSGRIIGKGYDPEEQVKTINYIRQTYGDEIYMVGSFIVGLPEESIESVTLTQQRIIANEIKLHFANFIPLWISKKNIHTWDSAFNLNMQEYGYSLMPGADPESYDNSVPWQNNYMNIDDAYNLVREWRQKSQSVLGRPTPTVFKLDNLHIAKTSSELISKYKKQVFEYLNGKK